VKFPYVETLGKRLGLKIFGIEDVAWRKRFISKGQLKTLGQQMSKNEYGQYLLLLAQEASRSKQERNS